MNKGYAKGDESREQGIIREYSTTLRPVSAIADQFGITQAGLYMILERHNVPRRAERGIFLRKIKSDNPQVLQVISPLHASVGAVLQHHRRVDGAPIKEFSTQVGLTQTALRRIEGGTYDWKLSQVQRICSQLKLSVDKVFQTASHQSRKFQNAA